MPSVSERAEARTAFQTELAGSVVSLVLSRSIWLITWVSPGSGEKMSKHSVRAGDVAALLARFSGSSGRRRSGAEKILSDRRHSGSGLDGFWLHRVLQSERRRKPCRRSVVDRDVASTAARDEGPDRRRGPASARYWHISAVNLGCARW